MTLEGKLIPDKFFEKKVWIPGYGLGSSMMRNTKGSFIDTLSMSQQSTWKYAVRDTLRTAEFLTIAAYNAGLYSLGQYLTQ